ncbi:MAG: hypothetical protein FJ279_17635, partial [Planctomycetes bacterium]|nr:hypothetical protein [Planctomycetota bacterium]
MFLIPAVPRAYGEARQNRRAPDAFLLAVSVGLFVLMSLSSGKRINYLISLLPFLAVLVGREWAELWSGRAMTRVERGCAWLMTVAVAAAAVAAGVAFAAVKHDLVIHAIPIGVACALAATAMVLAIRRAQPHLLLAALLLLMLGLAWHLNAVLLPRLNSVKSLRPLALYLRELKAAQPEAQLAIYRFSHPESLNFYSGLMFEPIRDPESAQRFLTAEGLRLCVLDRDNWHELRQACRA